MPRIRKLPGTVVLPRQWKPIVAEHPYDFNPRMIFRREIHGRWVWQAGPDVQYDIGNWKIYWQIGERTVLKTMDEFVSMTS